MGQSSSPTGLVQLFGPFLIPNSAFKRISLMPDVELASIEALATGGGGW